MRGVNAGDFPLLRLESPASAKLNLMIWANLLHFYQPHGQKREIIDAIVAQCYRPVGAGILAHPRARLTINFTGGLLEQLVQYGHDDVLELYRGAARRGQVEFVGSGMYHAILPLLPDGEAERQVRVNNETCRRILGEVYQPKGLFLPEMAWNPKLAPMLERLGFEWVLLDELAYDGHVDRVDWTKTYRVKGSGLRALFREHRLSGTLMSAAPRDVARLKTAARNELAEDRYVVTGMDGETFGHHRVGHEQMLFGMFADDDIELVKLSEVFERFPEMVEVATVASTWASSADDIKKDIQFISWNDPHNELHQLQWHLLEMAVAAVEDAEAPTGLRARLDWAVASDQFFWASARPWWMIEHIESGAHELAEIVREAGGGVGGHRLYEQIMGLAWEWQRTGKIDRMHGERADLVRVPFKERTLEQDDEGTWQAFMDMMREAEREAAGRGDYEEAILWRDGLYKLEHKLDIYDALYVLDLVHRKLPRAEIEGRIAEYKRRFAEIRGGQVEQRSN
jgi:hypothetical protein